MSSNALTKELLILRTKQDRVDLIKNLNLWGNDLDDVSYIKELPLLEVVSLSVNNIATLKDFAYLKNLKELFLRKNLIADFKEVLHLTKCSNLRVLWLNDNPISEHPNYRLYVIKILSQITKLDDTFINFDEKIKAENTQIDFSSTDKNRVDGNNNYNNNLEENKKLSEISIFSSDLHNQSLSPQISKSDLMKYKNNNFSLFNSFNENSSNKNNNVNISSSNNVNIKQSEINKFNIISPASYNVVISNSIEFDNQTNQTIQNNQTNKNNNTINTINTNNIGQTINNTQRKGRTENILGCIISLMNELNENELEDIKQDIDLKIKKFNGIR